MKSTTPLSTWTQFNYKTNYAFIVYHRQRMNPHLSRINETMNSVFVFRTKDKYIIIKYQRLHAHLLHPSLSHLYMQGCAMLFHIHEKVKLYLFLQVYNIKRAKQSALRFTNQTKIIALKKKKRETRATKPLLLFSLYTAFKVVYSGLRPSVRTSARRAKVSATMRGNTKEASA